MSEVSAFGVVHKSFKNLFPKLGQAYMKDNKVRAHVTMDEKLRRHAVEARLASGEQGRFVLRRLPAQSREKLANQPYRMQYGKPNSRLGALREQKAGAQGIYDRIGRQGRKNKVLP